METVWTTRGQLIEVDKVRNQKFYSFNANDPFDADRDKLYELPVIWQSPRYVFFKVLTPPDFGPQHDVKLRMWFIGGHNYGVCYKTKLEALHHLLYSKISYLDCDVRDMKMAVGIESWSPYSSDPPPSEGKINRHTMRLGISTSAMWLDEIRKFHKLYLAELRLQESKKESKKE